MEVRGISQGGQTTLETNNSYGKAAQVNNTDSIDRAKNDDNKSTENKSIKEKDLKNAVDKLNKFLEDNKTHAEYEYHDKFNNDLMIKIVDDKSGEVIQEFPPKKILDIVARMLEVVGVLFDKKA